MVQNHSQYLLWKGFLNVLYFCYFYFLPFTFLNLHSLIDSWSESISIVWIKSEGFYSNSLLTGYFLCFRKFLLAEIASFRLFLLIIFSFQSFRYHTGITNGYQCTYWYYDSDERNVQVEFLLPLFTSQKHNQVYPLLFLAKIIISKLISIQFIHNVSS